MSFARPWMLMLLIAPVSVFILSMRAPRSKRDVIRFSDAGLLRELRVNPVPLWRRRLPVFALCVSMGLMVLATAEPQQEGPITESSSTVVLALDVSFSMQAQDVSPDRFSAAKSAAADFINAAPPGVQIGLVVFAGRSEIIATPGTPRADLLDAIENMQLAGGTAIGEAIFTSLTLLDTDGWVPDPADPTRSLQRRSGAVVLMSDGATNTGRPDADGAAAAGVAGVPVYTIAFGTASGVIQTVDGEVIDVPAAPGPLRVVAETTKGSAFEATTGEQLSSIFESLAKKVATVQGLRSISHWFALAALLWLVLTAALWIRFGARI